MRLGSETEADSETTEGETTSTEDENQDTEDEDFHCEEEMKSEFEDDIEKRLRHSSCKLSLNLGLAVFILKGLKVIPSFGSLLKFFWSYKSTPGTEVYRFLFSVAFAV